MSNTDIIGIGKFKSIFMDNVKFESMDEYLKIAKMVITKCAPKNLVKEMLSSEDVISNIAYHIMMADWKFNGNGDRYGYRSQMARFAINSYITRRRKKNAKCSILSLNQTFAGSQNEDSSNLLSTLADKQQTPDDNLAQDELSKFVYGLATEGLLSKRECDYIKLHYYDGKTFQDIATQYGVKRQAVHQSIKNALNTLREHPTIKRIINEN